eukprot:1580519-Amphidinium_carterae.1
MMRSRGMPEKDIDDDISLKIFMKVPVTARATCWRRQGTLWRTVTDQDLIRSAIGLGGIRMPIGTSLSQR